MYIGSIRFCVRTEYRADSCGKIDFSPFIVAKINQLGDNRDSGGAPVLLHQAAQKEWQAVVEHNNGGLKWRFAA